MVTIKNTMKSIKRSSIQILKLFLYTVIWRAEKVPVAGPSKNGKAF